MNGPWWRVVTVLGLIGVGGVGCGAVSADSPDGASDGGRVTPRPDGAATAGTGGLAGGAGGTTSDASNATDTGSAAGSGGVSGTDAASTDVSTAGGAGASGPSTPRWRSRRRPAFPPRAGRGSSTTLWAPTTRPMAAGRACAYKTLTYALAHAPDAVSLAQDTYKGGAAGEELPFLLTAHQSLICNGAQLENDASMGTYDGIVQLAGTRNAVSDCHFDGGHQGGYCLVVNASAVDLAKPHVVTQSTFTKCDNVTLVVPAGFKGVTISNNTFTLNFASTSRGPRTSA